MDGFLFPKLDVMKMTNPFKMQFFYGKGTIAKRLNKSNHRYERAVSNIGVTKTPLKFEGRSVVAPQKIFI